MTSSRLSILTDEEIHSLYEIPDINDEEREFLFELDAEDIKYLDSIKNISQKINYILQLGYYKATNYFFQFSFQKRKSDVLFILKRYFPDETFPKKKIARKYHYNNRRFVINKYGVIDINNVIISQLEKEAKSLVKRHALPKFILQELLDYCLNNNLLRPAYSTMQNIVSRALRQEQQRLNNKFYAKIEPTIRSQLDNLLNMDDLFYKLTLIKKDQKDFTTTEIINTVKKQQMIYPLFLESKKLISRLNISEQNVIYYANLAEFYTIQKLKRFKSRNQARLYLLCYIHRRLLIFNDYLMNSFSYKINKYNDDAEQYQRSKVETVEAEDKERRAQASKILAININKSIPDHQIRERAFEVIPQSNYKKFLKDFHKPNLNRDFYRWEWYGQQSLVIKRNLRPIFKVLEFTCTNIELRSAVTFFKRYLLEGGVNFHSISMDDIPFDFFSKSTT
ncbi:DUF4158 domain-containing protein [Xenorhabdus szentirmaii]|uniref:DUF4158 domain-containing protein n=1 Tax=Xenorhabdus szentirmaii TaxID=290112 RepID=UPI002B4061F5|nr:MULTISPECIES: DUF4158 domain-containing protein [unclassified Xenorhabdus]